MNNYKVLVKTTLTFIKEINLQADDGVTASNNAGCYAYVKAENQNINFDDLVGTRVEVLETKCLDNE